jgi:hypothetical protein
MQALFRELYFGLVAILMLSEMVASNLFSVFFEIGRPAELFAVSLAVAHDHMLNLAGLNLIAGIGATLVLWVHRHESAALLGRIGVTVTVLGMLLYSGYQYTFVTVNVSDISANVKAVAIVYAALGIGAWFVGKPFRKPVVAESKFNNSGMFASQLRKQNL